ncbi:phosphonate transport system permease protein [Sporomusaceae bacterium BoRhaA]|uniref:phosphonate ABC transporter, permease protein PhnE n=1 Tax=Pelorhabdus rhamnosifermentans TaxID=2772457 RepID=UPI001C0613EF|nr:phosphonate ABC transporter, permease protein PhnE [Pelorhabdus rhamnosifermentans]MBU2699506.1 phosphonate transport system permease protein [Pelorhabdus rhamnosifermentans]
MSMRRPVCFPVRPLVPWFQDVRVTVKQLAVVVFLAGVYVWSAAGTHLSVAELVKGLPQLIDIIGRMLPPNFEILPRLIEPTVETLQISIWGTTLAIFFTIPFGLIAARNISPHPLLYHFGRFILNAMRSISELIFALVFVAAVGLGPFPGVLALAFHSVGMLGKFLADAIENIDFGPVEALLATGASKWQVIVYAIIPQVLPEFVTICLYQWELNFRSATILGIVGAGGIGFELVTSMRLFMYQDMTVILIVILGMVMIVDYMSSHVRSKIL